MRRALLFTIIFGLCLLTAAALVSQARTQTRGLDLGSPPNRPGIYGINIDPLGSATDQAQQLEAAQQNGFTWARQSFNYQTNDWAASDQLIDNINRHDLKLVAVLTGSPPPDPEAFSRFTAGFAARYADQIDVYQIWDEPNLESGWGGPPEPAEYARLLQLAYAGIHKADPTATVLLAGLAPTVETGPKNLSDILYLRQLYELGAGPYFDAVAGKPYGFNFSPADRTVDPNVLNFSRLILLREEMIAHGNGDKFLWSSNFGWNTRPSIWGHVSVEEQLTYTRAAYVRTASEWLWAGPMFLETSALSSPSVDPHEGFAMPNMSGIVPQQAGVVVPGNYSPSQLTAYAQFEGAWKFSDLGADIPQNGPATIRFDFEGTELALTLRRNNYRAYLFVTVDGQPANALPRDSNGEAYAILTSPDLAPRTDTITLVTGLAPGKHTAFIRADRGWDQWAIVNIRVGPNVSQPDVRLPLSALAIIGLVNFIGLLRTISTRSVQPPISNLKSRLSDSTQTFIAALLSALLWASAWLTWGSDTAQVIRKYGDAAPLIVTLLTAGLFYYSPFLILTLLCLALLFSLFYLRPDLSLPLIAFTAPFYLMPRPLWDRAFSMVEILTVLAFVPAILRLIPRLRLLPFSSSSLLPLDLSILLFVIISAASLFVADVRGVAIREFRVIVLEPALFYLLLRLAPLDQKGIWRIADFFLLGAALVAAIGLGNLVTGTNLITAEGGVARIRSVFGSPNNLGLFLGRALPIAVAVALLSRPGWRRLLYALAASLIGVAIILSFSKGALLLGVPAALATILIFWGGRRAALALAGLAAAGGAALIPLSRHPRFADLLNLTSGTSFFRLQLWRSALAMFADHPVLGVGLDNFLYAYRGKYILPEAWQEPNLPHAHNVFLDALTRLGLLGLLAFLALFASFFSTARDTLRRLTDPGLRALTIGLIASMVNTLAHGLVDTGYWFVDLAFVFMMTLGLMAAIHKTCQAPGS
ncbi:MAG: O-antigen ligase family protein [Chloroflexi bacterium]|nr:O-antigen ligase family protein [Chloroflexota bacterium]